MVKHVNSGMEDCPDCGTDDLSIETTSTTQGAFYDGDEVTCKECGLTGSFSVSDNESGYINWNFESETN